MMGTNRDNEHERRVARDRQAARVPGMEKRNLNLREELSSCRNKIKSLEAKLALQKEKLELVDVSGDSETTGTITNTVSSSFVNDEGKPYVAIHNLYVSPWMRGQGEARNLMKAIFKVIETRWLKLPIKIFVQPYGRVGLNQEELVKFYSKYENVEVIELPEE